MSNGLLRAFLEGTFGEGATSVANSMDRRELEATRIRERNEDRDEQRALQREIALMRYGGGTGAGSNGTGVSRGKGALLDPAVAAEQEELRAVRILMADKGVSEPEARAMIAAGRTGENPLKSETTPSLGENDSPLDARANRQTTADPAKFKAIMRDVGQALRRASNDGKDAEHVAKADRVYRETNLSDDIMAGRRDPGAVADAQAAVEGKDRYNVEGGVQYNTKTGGGLLTTAVGQAQINRDNAQAAENSAGAAKKSFEVRRLKLNNGMTDAEIRAANQSLTTQVNSMTREYGVASGNLQRLRREQATATGEKAKAAMAPEIAAAQEAVNAAKKALDEARKAQVDFSDELRNRDRKDDDKPKSPKGADVVALRKQAAKAIADGKSPTAVKARFKELTGQDY